MQKLTAAQRDAIHDHLRQVFANEEFTELFFRWLHAAGRPEFLNDPRNGAWKRTTALANSLARARYEGLYKQIGSKKVPQFYPTHVDLIIEQQNTARNSKSADLTRAGHKVYQVK